MTAQRQGQRAANHDEQLDHGAIVAGICAQFNPDGLWRWSG
jgi:hypothetical protein